MIKAFTAFTGEVDDIDAAVAEILEALGDQCGKLGNSVGILSCYSDFVESGVVRELCRALPFDVIGATTLGNVVRGSEEKILLSLMVLSSDDASFAVCLTEPIASLDESPIRDAYVKTANGMPGEPKLLISFVPLLVHASGDFYADAFAKISGGVPNFGMITVDNNLDYRDAVVIHNGEAYSDRCAFALVGGSVDPRFYVASISSKKIFMEKGVVTKALGNQVMSINNGSVAEYLERIGLAKNPDGTIKGVNAFPFVVDYNDGSSPVVRVIFATTPEGYALCGGDIPEGATLSVGQIDGDEVIATTSEALMDAIVSGGASCFLMFSCVGRYFILDYKQTAEMDLVREMMGRTDIPYMFAYSGGELCPVSSGADDVRMLKNRNHNDTFILCAL
jgi:hypothetical protein